MMRNAPSPDKLGKLEYLVMEFIWTHGPSTSEQVREGLRKRWPMKDSTARTVLRRLESKGFLSHSVDGRTYIYQGVEDRENVAIRAVRQIVDRFCQGSVESLLVGMVENEVIDKDQLSELARTIQDKEKEGRKK